MAARRNVDLMERLSALNPGKPTRTRPGPAIPPTRRRDAKQTPAGANAPPDGTGRSRRRDSHPKSALHAADAPEAPRKPAEKPKPSPPRSNPLGTKTNKAVKRPSDRGRPLRGKTKGPVQARPDPVPGTFPADRHDAPPLKDPSPVAAWFDLWRWTLEWSDQWQSLCRDHWHARCGVWRHLRDAKSAL